MAGIFASYPIEGGSTGGVSSLNSLTGALTLVAGSGITITPSGSNITIASSGGSGADQQLSNLSGTTAVPIAISPAVTHSIALGDATHVWETINVRNITNPSGNISHRDMFISTVDGFPINLGGSGITNAVTIQNASPLQFFDSGSANSVGFQAPTTVTTPVSWILPAADGTSGQVLSTDGAGTLSWASGGGATTALDNLASVAINTGLAFGPSVAGSMTTANNGGGNSQSITIATGSASGTRGDITFDAHQVHIPTAQVTIGTNTVIAGGTLSLAGAGDAQISLEDSNSGQIWAVYASGTDLHFQGVGGSNPTPLLINNDATDGALTLANGVIEFGNVGLRINGVDGASGTFTTVDLKIVTVTHGLITSIV